MKSIISTTPYGKLEEMPEANPNTRKQIMVSTTRSKVEDKREQLLNKKQLSI